MHDDQTKRQKCEKHQTQSVNEFDSNGKATGLIAYYLQVSNELKTQTGREIQGTAKKQRGCQKKNSIQILQNKLTLAHTHSYISIEALRCWLLSFSCICDLLHKTISVCMSNVSFGQNKVQKYTSMHSFMVSEHANERINSRKKILLDTPYHHWLVGWLVGEFYSLFFWFIISQLLLQ